MMMMMICYVLHLTRSIYNVYVMNSSKSHPSIHPWIKQLYLLLGIHIDTYVVNTCFYGSSHLMSCFSISGNILSKRSHYYVMVVAL